MGRGLVSESGWGGGGSMPPAQEWWHSVPKCRAVSGRLAFVRPCPCWGNHSGLRGASVPWKGEVGEMGCQSVPPVDVQALPSLPSLVPAEKPAVGYSGSWRGEVSRQPGAEGEHGMGGRAACYGGCPSFSHHPGDQSGSLGQPGAPSTRSLASAPLLQLPRRMSQGLISLLVRMQFLLGLPWGCS